MYLNIRVDQKKTSSWVPGKFLSTAEVGKDL